MGTPFFKILLVAGGVSTLAGCIKEVDLGAQQTPPVPVLNGLFNASPNTNTMRFVMSGTPGADFSQPDVPEGAHITLLRNGEILWEGPPDDKGYCTLPSFTPNQGDVLSVTAQSDDFDPLFATDTVPAPPSVFEARYVPDVFSDEYGDPLPELSVRFADNPLQADYYELLFFGVNYSSLNDSSSLVYYSLPYQPNNILKNEGDQDFRPALYFFSDEIFNGQVVDFKIISSAGVLPGERVKGRPWGVTEDGKYVLFRKISHSWYRYRKQWTRHYYTQTIGAGISNINDAILDDFQRLIFAPDPVPMFSNVTNGLGIFAAGNLKIIKLAE